MFANPTNVGISQRVVATLVASAVVLASIGVYTTAQAANLTNISNTLSDSDLSVTSAHTIAFTIPTGSSITTGETVTITFPAGFTGVTNVTTPDVTTTVGGSTVTPTVGSAGQNVTLTNFAAAAGQEVIVAIADGNITNPGTAGSYEIVVTDGTDTGKTRVAIIDNVLVTAIVNTTFDFTITGLATSTAVNGTTTTGSTSPTAIPFGTLVANQIKTLAQRLNVSTNARNGFVVTVEQDSDLQSATGAVIDSFSNGTYVNTPTTWSAPTNNVNQENTWGHWGLTSADSDLNGDEFGSALFVAASTTPREVFEHDGPSDGTTTDIGETIVGYQIQITPLQEAADDYNTTLTYIATPTF